MGISHSGLANRYYAIRYMHLISGRTDLSPHAFRINAFLKALRRKTIARQKIPFSVDLLEWVCREWFEGNESSDSHPCLRDAVLMGFSSVWGFRRSKTFDIAMCHFFRGDSAQNLTVFYAKSKNDPGGIGVSRTSIETSSNLCPVRACSRWLIRSDWGPQSGDLVFPPNVRRSVGSLLKYADVSNNIPMADISTHSLRSGGSTALYHVGVDMGTIQKWGRRNIQCFLRYIFGFWRLEWGN